MKRHVMSDEAGIVRPPKEGPAEAQRIGWLVFVALVVLILLEYVAFLAMSFNLPLMIAMNVLDAALIMYYFMHVSRIWRREHNHNATEDEN
jgi:heme/copper-type cytochrome/quinol oxidase subunit 4